MDRYSRHVVTDSRRIGARQDKSVFFEAIGLNDIKTNNHLRRRARRSTSEKINGGTLLDLIKSHWQPRALL